MNIYSLISESPYIQPPTREITAENIDALKIPYTPNFKPLIAARLDHIAQKLLEQNKHLEFFKIGTPSIPQIVLALKETKDEIIHEMKQEIDFEKWLDNEINTFDITTMKVGDNILIKFWQDCFEKWAAKNNLEKYVPDKDLEDRLNQFCKKLGRDYAECSMFVVCYLQMEDLFEKDNYEMFIEILIERGYRLTSKPLPNDIIVHLNSDGIPVHFGVFRNRTRIISKIGSYCILEQNPEEEELGNFYIILRTNYV